MLKEIIAAGERAIMHMAMKHGLFDSIPLRRASCLVQHRRPYDFDEKNRMYVYKEVDDSELVWNVITNSGRDFIHTQSYGSSPGSNGLNYIGLSNDSLTETTSSTTLSNEIATNGLSRAQGSITHTGGTNQTVIDKTFTATGTQSAQKGALFTASSNGTINHILSFTQRALISGDTLQTTWTITLG